MHWSLIHLARYLNNEKRSFTSLFSSAPKNIPELGGVLSGDSPDILPPLAKNQCDYRTALDLERC